MKKLSFLVLLSIALYGQKVTGQKVLDKFEAKAYSMCKTEGNHFVIAGCVNYHDGHGKDVYLAEIDGDGAVVWEKRFGGDYDDIARAVSRTEDGDLVIVGITKSFGVGDGDAYLIKTDKMGNKIWEKTYGSKAWDSGYAVSVTVKGDILLVGMTRGFDIKGYGGIYLVKTDKDGNKIWEKVFGGKKVDKANAITEARDGNFVIAGNTQTHGIENDIYLIKINKDGKKLWSKVYGDEKDDDKANAIISTGDGGLLIGGVSDYDLYLLKIDKNGNKIWEKRFGGDDGEEAYSLLETEDGFIGAGYTYSDGGSGDIYLVKVNKQGNKMWEKRIDLKGDDYAHSIVLCADGSYLIAGYAGSRSQPHIVLIKLKEAL